MFPHRIILISCPEDVQLETHTIGQNLIVLLLKMTLRNRAQPLRKLGVGIFRPILLTIVSLKT
jgi:hypothetical protein